MNLNCAAGADERLLHRFFLVSIFSKPLLPLPSLQDDVNVAGNEGTDVLALSCLHAVVLVLIVSKVKGEHIGGGSPSLDSRQWPCLQDLLCLLIQSKNRVFRNSQKSRNKLVSPFLLLLKMLKCIWCRNLNPAGKDLSEFIQSGTYIGAYRLDPLWWNVYWGRRYIFKSLHNISFTTFTKRYPLIFGESEALLAFRVGGQFLNMLMEPLVVGEWRRHQSGNHSGGQWRVRC